MKASPRSNGNLSNSNAVAELRCNELMIPLPDPRLLRLVARSLLLSVAILSLPWIRVALLSDPAVSLSNLSEDKLFYMPKLLIDMQAQGLIHREGHTLFIGDPGYHAALFQRNGISCLPEDKIRQIPVSQPLDFVFLIAGGFRDAHFLLIDKFMKVGGVTAFQLGAHPVKPFNLPANYRMVYIQNIGRTIIAVKKLYHDNPSIGLPERRLLSVSRTKEPSLQLLEDALLEPPVFEKRRKKIRYLPELTGESLDRYPRRVFVDIGSPGRVGADGWFKEKYPKRNNKFEMVRVDLMDGPAFVAGAIGSVGEWLRTNVRKEEYVVVKAEVEAVEEMVKGEVMGLVDELFFECRNQWEGEEVDAEKGVRTKRAYWECLALFGKLRESGVAVHQWWG